MTEDEALLSFLKNPRVEVEKTFDIHVDDDGGLLLVLSVWGENLPLKGFVQVFEKADEAVLWRVPDCAVRLVNIPAPAAEALRKAKGITIAETEGQTMRHAYRFDIVVADPS